MQPDDACKVAGVLVGEGGGCDPGPRGQRLSGEDVHILLGDGHPGVVEKKLLLPAQLRFVQLPGLHRGQRRVGAGRGGRVEGLFAEDLHRPEMEPPGQRAVVRLEELVRRFDLLGVPTQQGGDAALRRTVAQ